MVGCPMTISHLDAVGQEDQFQTSLVSEKTGVAVMLCSLTEDVN